MLTGLTGAGVAGVMGLVLLGGLPAGAEPEGTLKAGPGAPGIGDSYWPQDGNGGIDVQSYTVDTRYQAAAGKLAGKTRIKLKATQTATSFNLDFLLKVQKVTVDGKAVGFSRPTGHELKIRKRLAKGDRYTVVVTYADKPGKYGYAGERNWLADKSEVVAMNQPHMAPWWFPSNDHPQDKATFAINVTVPKGQQGIANGNLIGKKKSGKQVTWKWRATEPMATYLAFFAAGRFALNTERSDGRTMVNAVSKQLSPSAQKQAMTWLNRSDDVVEVLEEDLGDYPFDANGGVVTSLPVGFALENQTRPTYGWFGPDMSLLVHELGHQWYGDSVAIHQWRDIWLNEGFATFLEKRYAEVKGGQTADAWLRANYTSEGAGSPLWKVRLDNPGAGRIFAGQVYERGGMTLQALRNRIGDDDFFELLRTWAQEHRNGNATVKQFETRAEQISGEDLGGFFDAWLRAETKPANTGENGLG